MKPDLNLLLIFDAVARFGSVTEAANHLALSQPAVSHALNRLRAVTGDRLFMRSGRGLVPTARAVEMSTSVRSLIFAAQQVIAPPGFDPATAQRVFRIAASDYATITLLPALMRALGSEAPRVSIELLPTGPNILQQLELGKLDLSFWGAAPPPAFAGYTRLFHEHYVGVARAGHPIFASDIVTIEDYLRFAHATVSMQTPGANVIDAALATQGFVRRIGLTSPGFIASLAVLPQTDLIASLPARLCEAPSSGLRHFDLPLDVQPYPYGILWHPRTDQLASHIWLRRVICRVLQEKN